MTLILAYIHSQSKNPEFKPEGLYFAFAIVDCFVTLPIAAGIAIALVELLL